MCLGTKLKIVLKTLISKLDFFLGFIIRLICWSKIREENVYLLLVPGRNAHTGLLAVEQELGSLHFWQSWHDSAIIGNQTAVMFSCSTSLGEVLFEAAQLSGMCVGAQLKIELKSIIHSRITWLIFTVAECMSYAPARSDILNNVIFWNETILWSSLQQKNISSVSFAGQYI